MLQGVPASASFVLVLNVIRVVLFLYSTLGCSLWKALKIGVTSMCCSEFSLICLSSLLARGKIQSLQGEEFGIK